MDMTGMRHAKVKNDSAVAGTSDLWVELPAVAGQMFMDGPLWIPGTDTRNVVGMGIFTMGRFLGG